MRRFGSLLAFPVAGRGREEIGNEGETCAYCGVSLAGGRCIRRRRSTGFGLANQVIERLCERRCRSLFDERGPKWSNVDGSNGVGDGSVASDDEAAENAGSSSASEVQS